MMSSESAITLIAPPIPKIFSRPASRPGVLAGVLMFVASLLPSLLPRLVVTQGIVSGISFMVGYGLGMSWQWTWNFLGIPKPAGRWWHVIRRIWFVVLALLVVAGLWGFVGWQNDVRDDFGMDRTTPAIWLAILPVAIVFWPFILIICRSILKLLHFLIRWLGRRHRTAHRFSRRVGAVVLVEAALPRGSKASSAAWGSVIAHLLDALIYGALHTFRSRLLPRNPTLLDTGLLAIGSACVA